VVSADITEPANWRSAQHFDAWLKSHNLVGMCGVDTRRLTRRVRDGGAPSGVIAHAPDGRFDTGALVAEAAAWPGLEGMDLAKEVTCRQTYGWDETRWQLGTGFGRQGAPRFHVVAVDYGAKRNILRCLADLGCRVTVVPATATTDDVMRHKPDGVFLSNGPGDPAATGEYAVPVIRDVLKSGIPLFGICLGHQLLALAWAQDQKCISATAAPIISQGPHRQSPRPPARAWHASPAEASPSVAFIVSLFPSSTGASPLPAGSRRFSFARLPARRTVTTVMRYADLIDKHGR
jgi:carbamoyl-phosphate synthase small subunit